VVSKIVVETIDSLGMTLPRPTADLDDIRRKYDEDKQRIKDG
jgi:hypothetical protein